MSDRTPALHAERARVLPPEDGAQWRWELAVTPVSWWRMARILLADAAHDRLVPVSEWLGRRRSRLAHAAQDVEGFSNSMAAVIARFGGRPETYREC